jgi:hypothetical protein
VGDLSGRVTNVRITFPEATRWSYNTLLADGAKAETSDTGVLLNLDGFGYVVAEKK